MEPTPPEPPAEVPPPNADQAPVMGELIDMQAVQPSAAQRKADAKGRVGNTFTQVGVPAALLTLLVYVSGFWDADLDPTGPGRDMPTLASNAILVLLTWLLCRRMNREGLNATDEDAG